jgi:uncharacterized phiE125 gp8 family phage protein
MKRMLLEAPAAEPVLAAEAKAHMRVDGAAEDDLITSLIVAARILIEAETRRALITQRWRAIFEAWPAAGIVLPIQPVQSVEVVVAVDHEGGTTIIDEEDYELQLVDGSLRLNDRTARAAHYEIDFTAGYGAAGSDVPQALRQAIRLLVTHWYEHRSAVGDGETASETPLGWRTLVAPYRRLALC